MRSRIDELLPLAEQNDGLVTASQARALGITDSVLARLTQRGRLERVARGVYRIPYFPADRLSQYREAVLWARASQGPEQVALSHETALGVYGISDVNPARVHLTVPKHARLRRRKPKWIVIHRSELPSGDVTTHEGLPVTTVAKSVFDVMETTGRLGVARQAIKDARKEGYISAAELNRLTRQLNQRAHGRAARERATAWSAKPVERLEKTLARVGREQGLDQERLRRWVSFLAICGVLEQAVERGVIDTYYLKGGVAMELRFAGAARTTKDFDLGLEGNRAERIQRLSQVLHLEFDAFTFRLKPEMHEMELADTVRVEVAVEYKTRAWQTVDIDLGPGGAREVDLVEPAITGLAEMGLPMARHVRCLGINEQVAQKLHACTGPQREDRARDVLDILLVDMLGQLDHVRTRVAAQRIFRERATHEFPPQATVPAGWRRELENLARELSYRTKDAEGIEREFAAVLSTIATAS